MAKYLIVYAHPNHAGHHGFFLNELLSGLKARNADYELIDLYAISYDPVLKADELYSAGQRAVTDQNKKFQEMIAAADRLVFIYPTWWDNMPAILKGFIDRTFVSGFGFKYRHGLPFALLKGKRAAIFSATGAPRLYSLFWTRNRSLKILSQDVLGFCGISCRNFTLGSVRGKRESKEARLRRIARRLVNYITR